MLKETPKSLRLYFAVIAGLSLLPFATAFIEGKTAELVSWPTLLNAAFGVWLAYIALEFERLLRNPTPIKMMLGAGMAWSVVSFAVSLRNGLEAAPVAGFILSILISVYLLKSVTRLSKEVSARSA